MLVGLSIVDQALCADCPGIFMRLTDSFGCSVHLTGAERRRLNGLTKMENFWQSPLTGRYVWASLRLDVIGVLSDS